MGGMFSSQQSTPQGTPQETSQGTPQRTQQQSKSEKIYKYHRLPTIVALTPEQISEINVKDINPKIETTYSSKQLTDDQQKALTAKLEEVYDDSKPKFTDNAIDLSKYGGRKYSGRKRKTRKTRRRKSRKNKK